METGTIKTEILSWIKTIVITILLAFIIKTFLFNSTKVKGMSMYPTLDEGNRLITSKITYIVSEPKHGDIVIFPAPDEDGKDYIKRVVGVPGDIVEIKEGKVHVNGKKIKEEYIEDHSFTDTYGVDSWEVPEDKLFVLGDNRQPSASKDSRSLGFIDRKSVLGKAVFRYFPFDSVGKF